MLPREIKYANSKAPETGMLRKEYSVKEKMSSRRLQHSPSPTPKGRGVGGADFGLGTGTELQLAAE